MKGPNHDISHPEDPTIFYDTIVDFNSFHGLAAANGGSSIIRKKDSPFSLSGAIGIIISCVGDENVGKSFIVSKLSNTRVPVGDVIHTYGLSVIYAKSKEKALTFIDSAGGGKPFAEMIFDK